MWHSLASWAFCISSIFLMSVPSCPVNIEVNPESGGTSDPTDPTDPALPVDTITVRFINETTYGLDVQFYVAASVPAETPLSQLTSILFVPENHVTTGIGLSGQGTVPPNDSDSVTISCSQAAAVGTLGGLFLGTEGEQMGYGTQRYATAGNYTCDGVITFYYRTTTDGFETVLVTE